MRSAIGNLKLALAYTLLAMGTLQTLVPEGGASPVWPPSGLALGALLIGGAHYWPGIVLGQLLGNGLVTGHWLMALGFGLGNAAAGLAGYHLFLRLKGKGAITFETPSDFVVLIAAGVVAAAASSAVGNSVYAMTSGHSLQWRQCVQWWQGDLLGILVVTPMMLAMRSPLREPWTPLRVAEALALLAITTAVSLKLMPGHIHAFAVAEQEALLFLMAVWAGLRFGVQGVLVLVFTTGLLLIWQYTHELSMLTAAAQERTLHHIWILVLTLTLIGVTLTLKLKALANERQDALGALADQESANQTLRQAQHLANVGHWELDIPTGNLKWSDEVFHLFELDRAAFAASYSAFLDAIHPEDRALVQNAYENSLKNRTPYEITHRLRMADGRIKWVVERCETTYDAQGLALRSVGTIQDITQKKLEEDATQRVNEARFSAIFDTVTDALVITNDEGLIEMVNPATQRIFGYCPEELMGQNIALLMPKRYATGHTDQMLAYRGRNESKIIGVGRELAGLHKNGKEIPIDVSINRTQFGGRIIFVGLIRDNTERKRTEAALREAKTQAEAANLAKSQFLATMTHELRTPLNSLLGMQQIVLMDAITDRQRDCLENGQKAGQHLLEMINNILDYTKIEAGKVELCPSDLDLHMLLRNTVMLLQPHTDGKPLQLGLHIDSNVPRSIRADALRLKQVLINLLQNAIKFTPEGEVNLRVSDIAMENGECKLRFEIQDTGIGIAQKDQHSLFEMFHQVDNSITRRFGGTGLGLAICKQLVLQMGGQIGVESEAGKGSTFWFEIPCRALHHSTHTLPATPSSQTDLRPLHGTGIVLFETDPTQQRALSRVLLGRGALIAIATTLTELRQHIAQPTCKLVLLGLPTEVPLVEITALLTPSLPMILLQPVGTESHDLVGVSARLAKPVTAETLLRTIDRVLH